MNGDDPVTAVSGSCWGYGLYVVPSAVQRMVHMAWHIEMLAPQLTDQELAAAVRAIVDHPYQDVAGLLDLARGLDKRT